MKPGQPSQPKNDPTPPQPPGSKPPQPAAAAQASPSPKGAAGVATKVRRAVILLGASAAVLLVCSLTLWAMIRDDRPRLNDDTVSIVKFVTTRNYQRLPLGERAEYMLVLEDRDDNDELKDLFNGGRISEGEYRAAIEEVWLGQQYKRSQKYSTLPPGPARVAYVRGLVHKKLEKDARKAAKSASGKKNNKDEPSDSVKRDESTEEARIAEWPTDARAKWEQFRAAYKTEKEALEEAIRKAAASQNKGQADTQVSPAPGG